MSSSSKIVDLFGAKLRLSGGEEDLYFRDIEVFGAQNDQLLRALRTLPSEAVTLDVGANIGITSLMTAITIPAGRVYAFEPSPRNVRYLRENISNNGLERIEVVPVAVGAEKGSVRFHMAPTGAHSTVIRSEAAISPNIADVERLTLDDWVAAKAPARLDFIKIDVEGYERYVLIGAADCIAKWRMPILMEFNSITTAFEDRMSPAVFAEALASVFDVLTVEADGSMTPVCDGDIRRFTFVNMTEHGHVDDVILRLKNDKGAADIRAALNSPA